MFTYFQTNRMSSRLDCIHQKVFITLFESQLEDSSNVCSAYQKQNWTLENISAFIKNEKIEELKDVENIAKQCQENEELIRMLKEDKKTFTDEKWKLLLFAIHDMNASPIDPGVTIPIKKGGQIEHLNIAELETRLLDTIPDIMMNQIGVPEILIQDDQYLDSETLGKQLKGKFQEKLEKEEQELEEKFEAQKQDIKNKIEAKKSELQKQLEKEIFELEELETKMKTEKKYLEEKIWAEQEKSSRNLMRELKSKISNFKKQASEVKKKVLEEVSKTPAADTLKKRKATEAEFTLQQAILKAGKKCNIPMLVLQGITTESIGKSLSPFGIKCSALKKVFEGKSRASAEVEHDILVITPGPTHLVVTPVQVKTEADVFPWDYNTESPGVKSTGAQTAVHQLQRDLVRIMELIPDVRLLDVVDINLRVAFPLAQRSHDFSDLTKADLMPGKEVSLLEKLGITVPEHSFETPDYVSKAFKTLATRYLAEHSTVPCKNSGETFAYGVSTLEMDIRTTESVLKSQLSEVPEVPDIYERNEGDMIRQDELMKNIKEAIENKNYRKKFQKENPKINLESLKVKSTKSPPFLINSQSGKHPIYGRKLVIDIIDIFDKKCNHQGKKPILEEMKNFEAFNEKGNPFILEDEVKNHIQNCEDCKEINIWKTTSKGLTQIRTEDLPQVLKYADKFHKGFALAYNRLKTWCDFPNFKAKVG